MRVSELATPTNNNVEQGNKVIVDADHSRVSTTSYTKGAYNANNEQINRLIIDTATTKQGKRKCITVGATVGSNLTALDDCIDEAVSGIANEIKSTGTVSVTPDTIDLYDDWANDSSSNSLTIVKEVGSNVTITNTVEPKTEEEPAEEP